MVYSAMLLLLVGLLAGVASGILGIGGGIFLVPVLVYGYGFTQHKAQGTTLATLALPICALAAWNYYRNGQANLQVALLIGAGFALGAWLGSFLVMDIPERLLKRLFALLLFGLAVRMFFSD